jgi:hypothetical protein
MRKLNLVMFRLFSLLLMAGLMEGCAPFGRAPISPAAIVYRNSEYGFHFTLPASWKGFFFVTSQWEGYATGTQGNVPLEQGPILSIRHPLWTAAQPRQDIPIMVFTLAQLEALQLGKLFIGAAPIRPTELGRNARYVFALQTRYNYADVQRIQEVESILEGKPLQTP